MRTIRAALLAAAVMAVAPALAQAERDQDRRGGYQGRGGDNGQTNNRPAPPQAQVPPPQTQVPAAPPARAGGPQQRGNGGGYRPGGQNGDPRAQYRDNRGQGNPGNMRPTPPQAQVGNVGQYSPGRGQWNHGDNGQWTRDQGQQGQQWRNQQGDPRSGRNDGRHDPGNANGNGQWDRDHRNDGDRRWNNDNGNNAYRGGSRQWNNGQSGNRYGRDDHRPDANWRNDRRYDWRGWRDSHRDVFRRGQYYAPRGYGYRSVYRGFFLEPFFYSSNYWLADPYEYRLPPVQWPYRWVRYYDDALLVDTTNGEVVDVIQNFFF